MAGRLPRTAAGHLMVVERTSPERPLAAYGAIMAAYTLTFVGPLALAARRGALPKRPRFADLALVGVGTFKLSRLLTTDAVTGFIRAPFVRYEGMEGVTTPLAADAIVAAADGQVSEMLVGWPAMLAAAWNAK